MKPPIITLLTDFGTQDYFVGAMKGVILSANPTARIVDLTHNIAPQDIHAAAFNLLALYRNFPAGTIHLAVVDPGVGSNRRPILIECADQLFVGPDNGLFSWICERAGNWRAYHLTNEKLFRHPTSKTFHGRDVFAPVAAALSNGAKPEEVGPAIEGIVQLEPLNPITTTDGNVEGRIIHVDRFGNCVTNLTTNHRTSRAARLAVNNTEITSYREFFCENSGSEGELFMLTGSAGFIEIAARNASAASILNARQGQLVVLINGAAHQQFTSG
ncbi:MAG: S-adenosyl-l-methionine hydroxide adenosyltransferase family protein [Pyrinomonadaceae bacterium]